ncbi:MAG TPA: hypothetical protein VHQ65_14470 [Thermoanaerobaculia bacterium]|nr:hypothetical protein [Thermoanaerobaculia bacterium]
MTTDLCPREDDLLDALARGFVAPELAAHAASCPACAELHLVAGGLLDERAAAMAEAPVPSAGTMWWRLKIRQRQEAEARARRSLLVGQAATLGVALMLVVGLFGGEVAEALRGLAGTVRMSTPLLVAVGVWVLLVPLAGWVALRQK